MIPTVEQNKVNAYDEMPYHSYSYPISSPDHMRTIGKLFGMDPPAVKNSRILELGCAEGGNILPHAIKYPKAELIGIDLSKIQIDAGKKHVRRLRLKNIELKHMSIVDVDQTFGKFDYIICHGVFSWVPDVVRDKIFEVCSKNLSPQGIAYISYNALPGWNMIRTIRDMMLYHSQKFTALEDKVDQSRLLLNFVNEALQENDNPYALMLKQEASMLLGHDDHYIRHEYLEEDNRQFYFSDFMVEASKQNLRYLSDGKISTMFTGNFPQKAAQELMSIDDIITTEQYMDFITNRRFRNTLLCHENVAVDRQLDDAMARNFTMSARVSTDMPISKNPLENNELITFYFNENKKRTISTESPTLKAILYTFNETQINPLSFDEVVERAHSKLNGIEKTKVEEALEGSVIQLFVKGMLELSLETGRYGKLNLNKPKLFRLALYQIRSTSDKRVVNIMHNSISIDYFDRLAGRYMNGRNTVAQILEKLIESAKAGEFSLATDRNPITKQKDLEKALSDILNKVIDKFHKAALLV